MTEPNTLGGCQGGRALAVTRRILGTDGSLLPQDAFWLGGTALFAGVAAAAGDLDLTVHVVVFGAGGSVLGSGHHWLGILAAACRHTDVALEHLAEATAIAKELDAPYWIAQSNIECAAALHSSGRVGDLTRADGLVNEAIAIAEPQGYGRVLTQADALRLKVSPAFGRRRPS